MTADKNTWQERGPTMQKSVYLWDLDGTLTDPAEGITKSVQHALEYEGIRVEDRTALYPFIGPPLKETFMERYGFSAARAENAVAHYREYFAVTGIFENQVYPGIPELLERLHSQGRRLILATSKPTVFARRILEHFQLLSCFTAVCGSELDGARTRKTDVIRFALEQTGTRPEDAAMIGDRRYDVEGARACGLAAVGVLYGYGSRQELEEAGADVLAADVPALDRLLL